MADKPKKKRILKNKTETVRQKAQAVSDAPVKKRHIRRTATKITTPIKAAHRFGKKNTTCQCQTINLADS